MRARKLRKLQVVVYQPTCKVPVPELIDLTLFDSDDETVILPPVPPAFEILDTSRAIRVRHHEVLTEVLVSFVRGYQRYTTEASVSHTVADWCIFNIRTTNS